MSAGVPTAMSPRMLEGSKEYSVLSLSADHQPFSQFVPQRLRADRTTRQRITEPPTGFVNTWSGTGNLQ